MIYIYLLGKDLNAATEVWASVNAKKRKKEVRRAKKMKRVERQKVKPPTPTRATDALIRDEKQLENQKREKERNREGSYPGTCGRLL